MIRDIETICLRTHDGAVKKLDEVRYISNFKRNLTSLSRLDLSSYKWRTKDGILKVFCSSKIVMKEKRYGGYYLLARSLV